MVVSHVSGWRVLFVCCLLVVVCWLVLSVGIRWLWLAVHSLLLVGCCMWYVVRCLLCGMRVTLVVACCVLFAVCAMSCGGGRYVLSVAYWLVLVVCGVIFVACVVYDCCVLCCGL